MNYDYGGVWARIPTPENLRIIRYLGGGGGEVAWYYTTAGSTRDTLQTFTSASYTYYGHNWRYFGGKKSFYCHLKSSWIVVFCLNGEAEG
jgi:hypothetical protein